MIRTDDTATEQELRDLFSMEPDDGPLDEVIGVCAGEWRRDGERWRFWSDEGCCERTARMMGEVQGRSSP